VLATKVALQRSGYPGGLFKLTVQDKSAAQVLAELSYAVLGRSLPGTLDQVSAQLRGVLGRRAALVILDDVKGSVAAPVLKALAETAKVATARERLWTARTNRRGVHRNA